MRYWGQMSRLTVSTVGPDAVADYFIGRDARRHQPDVTPMKLHLLMYLAQGQYLASTGHRLFDDEVDAYQHGPVIPSQLGRFSGRRPIAGHRRTWMPRLPHDVTEFLDRVWDRYAAVPAEELRAMTCDQEPWRRGGTGGFGSRLTDQEMAACFGSRPGQERVLPDQELDIAS